MKHPSTFQKLDRALAKPVLKRELFPDPVIIEKLELLRLDDNFLCRVISTDGAVGISVANNTQMISLWPIFTERLQPFFQGQGCQGLGAVAGRGLCVPEQLQATGPGTVDSAGHH